MKINPIQASDMVQRYKGTSAAKPEAPDIGGESDRVELSSEARSFASVFNEVKTRVETTSPEESERIAKIAAQIENGTYNVSGAKVADKMLGNTIDIEI